MNKIYDILQELKNESSTKAKAQILKDNANNELLKTVCSMALDPYLQFYIRKIPKYSNSKNPDTLENAIQKLYLLSSRQVTGNAGIAHLTEVLSSLSKEDAYVIERIIDKDLKCGVAESTVNKVFEDLIPVYPCLLAEKQDKLDNIKYPAYSQIKADGVRVNIIYDGKHVSFRGRSGRIIDLLGVHDTYFEQIMKNFGYPCVLDGELLVEQNGIVLERRVGNGIINKAIKGTITEKEAQCVRAAVWDLIPLVDFYKKEHNKPYKDRFAELEKVLKPLIKKNDLLSIIETKIVDNVEQAQEHFNVAISMKLEGTILKNFNGIWEDTRSTDLIKLKSEKECDLVVVGWNMGKVGTKRENKLGSLICESREGKVSVNVSGFDDNTLDEISKDFNAWKNKIITVLYNERIKSRDRPDTDSLFLPRYVEFREDKTVADKSEDIL